MRKQEKRNSKILNMIKEHVRTNIKYYFTIAIVFLIGIVIGVMFINNIDENQKNQIGDYLCTFTEALNSDYKVDTNNLLKSSITNNLLLALLLWFIGSTVVGIPIVYIIICIRGFFLGYTLSSIIVTYNVWKGTLFSLCTLLLQNIIFIPCILALSVSGIRLYKSIIKDKRKENIKIEILRHTIFSGFIAIFLVLASFVEVYASSNLLTICIKIFA